MLGIFGRNFLPKKKEMNLLINNIAQGLTYFLAMLFALTFHEAAHAFTSHMLGDDSAKSLGRLSLNPAVHVDTLGTIVLPLVCSLLGAPFIGWAKPVPYDERNFKNPVRDAMLTASAGPVSNLLMGCICMLFVVMQTHFQWAIFSEGSFFAPLLKLAAAMIYVNGMLAFLNLIPLPPLDGATILRAFVSRDFWDRYESTIGPYGFFIFLLLAFSGGLAWISGLTMVYVGFLEKGASFLISFL
jgi:Zn-dependent protease